MKKYIIWICIVYSVICSCTTVNAPQLILSRYELDFGKVMEGTPCIGTVSIYNRGNELLHLQNIATDCPCTKVLVDNRNIAENDSTSLHITLETNGKLGLTENYVVIQANTDTTIHYITVRSEIVKK